jgi:hypothetical protein
MTTVDQFLKALAEVESSDDPQAWGDGGRAMGRWQVHPDRLWGEMHLAILKPELGETWDHLAERILRTIWNFYGDKVTPGEIAMYWHVGHWCKPADSTWDAGYASRFAAALAKVQEEG